VRLPAWLPYGFEPRPKKGFKYLKWAGLGLGKHPLMLEYPLIKAKNMKIKHLKKSLILLAILASLGGYYGFSKLEMKHIGQTMGTHFTIKAYYPRFYSKRKIKRQRDQIIFDINQTMSTYDPQSQISQFNQLKSRKPFTVSKEFMDVLIISKKIFVQSKGNWDATVKPLYDLWDFEKKGKINTQKMPSKVLVERIKQFVGFELIQIVGQSQIRKAHPKVQIDLSSVAKGYTVDQIANYFEKKRIQSYLIEIGGEVRVGKNKPTGQPWKIGINKPEKNGKTNGFYKIINVTQQSVATSGDYRKYLTLKGKDYHHIINPKTGYPHKSNVVSATVISSSCAMADGLATALMLLTPKEGIRLIDSLPNTECLILKRDKNGNITQQQSKSFQKNS